MEWDKFWSDNKKILERSAFRYMGVMKGDYVILHITNVEPGSIEIPNHPKVYLICEMLYQDKSLGVSSVMIGPEVMLERTDAEEIKEGEEITLMRWGNVKVTKVNRKEDGTLDIVGEYVPNVYFYSDKSYGIG